MAPTHLVTNQVPELVDTDLAADPPLLEAVEREGAGWSLDTLHDTGRRAGSAQVRDQADAAHRNEPRLRAFDRVGNRVDEVDYDPGYHALLAEAVSRGFAGAVWAGPSGLGSAPRPGQHVARAAGFLVWSQAEAGHGCPVSMTPRRRARTGRLARTARALRTGTGLDRLRARPGRADDEGRPARRHGHDREAGRLGRPDEHDHGDAERRRHATP